MGAQRRLGNPPSLFAVSEFLEFCFMMTRPFLGVMSQDMLGSNGLLGSRLIMRFDLKSLGR